jgi:hypothetical protein
LETFSFGRGKARDRLAKRVLSEKGHDHEHLAIARAGPIYNPGLGALK